MHKRENITFFSSLYNKLLSLDMLGPTPTINYEGNERYSTLLGLAMTLFVFVIPLLTIQFLISNFIYRTNPDTFLTTSYEENATVLNNTSYQFYIGILRMDQVTKQFIYVNKSEFDSPGLVYFRQNNSGYFSLKIILLWRSVIIPFSRITILVSFQPPNF